jgi:ParD-like antitoxin of type II bacterial toxin-antitoxin system
MATSVRLDNDFVSDAKVYADANKRSVPKQIEHWAEIGRMVEDNPDLPYGFIQQVAIAAAEVKAGKATKYERGKRD